MAADLVAAVRDGSRVERACYAVAALLILSGLVHLGVLVGTGGPWSGPLSFRKPATFGLSFGLTLATLTWVLSLVTLRARTRAVVLTALAAASVVEVVVITVQAWRGLPSHFGVAGPGAGLVAAGAAAGAVAIIVATAVATVAVWRAPDPAPSMRLALRAGFAALLVALALGAYMLARGMVLAVGSADVAGAFAFTATVKPGHAATMHGVLVLPALAWVLSFADRPERFRLAVVRAATAGYALLAGVVVAEVLAGIDPLTATAPVLGSAAAVAGTAVLVGAGVVGLAATLGGGRTRVA